MLRASVLLLSGLAVSCTIMRPEGAFQREGGEILDDSERDSDEDIYTGIDAGGGSEPDARGDAAGAATPAVVGDYWMESRFHTRVRAAQLGLSVSTTTETAVYALVTVRARGDALELRDFQCTLRMTQSCESGCRSITTTLRDPATSARAYLPARRWLEVVGNRFRTEAVPYAVGFRQDYAVDPAAALPSSGEDPRVYDPDGGGEGVDLATAIHTTAGLPITCSVRLLQKIAFAYSGALASGRLGDGAPEEAGSDQLTLSSTCGEASATPEQVAPGALRFVAAPRPIDEAALPWPCPSLEEFEAAFR